MKTNYFVIPAITFGVAALGSLATSAGMPWYRSLALPDFTPAGSVIGAVWTVLYILATVAALIVWNRDIRPITRKAIAIVFVLNAVLNLGWSLVFFGMGQILPAVFVAAALGLSVAVLIAMVHPFSKLASALLAPYLLWVLFATYLNVAIWRMNS